MLGLINLCPRIRSMMRMCRLIKAIGILLTSETNSQQILISFCTVTYIMKDQNSSISSESLPLSSTVRLKSHEIIFLFFYQMKQMEHKNYYCVSEILSPLATNINVRRIYVGFFCKQTTPSQISSEVFSFY